MKSVPDFTFESRVRGRTLHASFDGGHLSSDGGILLLLEAEKRVGVIARLSSAISDRRESSKVRQSVTAMLTQRILGICCGYEDCNDFDTLREDPLFKIAARRLPGGKDALASQPTLCRLENSVGTKDLYRMGEALLEAFIEKHRGEAVTRIILDADGTEDPTHGQQEFAFYNAFHGRDCYIPMLVFATVETKGKELKRTSDGEQELVCSVLRTGRAYPFQIVAPLLKRLLKRLRSTFPEARVSFRADSGFAAPVVYDRLEEAGADYAVALKTNSVLESKSDNMLHAAGEARIESGQPVTALGEVPYKAKRWKKERRVVVKAEVGIKSEDRRYVLTNMDLSPSALYAFYAERGDVENRIKELKEDLFSGRTSCHRFLANQFRLLLHAAALMLVQAVRGMLCGTELGKMQAGSLRHRLFKVAARVVETTRRIVVHLPTAYPWKVTWERILGPPGLAAA